MEAGISQRIGLAALAAASTAACAAVLLVLADGAGSRAPGDALQPDLVVQRPDELYVRGKRQQRLRVSNTVANIGTGPLEIMGGDSGDGCPVPGKPPGRHTLQKTFKDSDHDESLGFFRRSHDTGFDETEAGCSRFHPKHNHWHFDNFARYTLIRVRRGKARVVGASRKVSFCVIDTGRPYPQLDGSPGRPYYPQDPDKPKFPTCSDKSVDGLSVGWEDTYGASLPGQGINVTGRPNGIYCLVLEADPPSEGLPDGVLLESDDTNNVHVVRFRMKARRHFVKRLGSSCKAADGLIG